MGGLLGTINLLAFTALGMLVSYWSNSNRTSVFLSLIIYLVLLLPTQFPGQAHTGAFGDLLQRWNPLEATNVFLAWLIVNNRTLDETMSWIVAPVAFAILMLGVLFLYAGPGLRLDAVRARLRPSWGRVAGLLVAAGLVAALARPALWRPPRPPTPPCRSRSTKEWATSRTGDVIEFTTRVTNNGAESTPRMIVAMNIINLTGEVVDLEDWSPQRTQVMEPLAAGQTAEHSWTVNTIIKGDYMVYMVVASEPSGAEATSLPVASSGIHLTVAPFTRINPGGVLPLAAGLPLGLTALTGFIRFRRRRAITAGAGEG
ncbi:MAG: hypothetical protein QJR03_14490 [Sphaerobacter sp.]|nr:hypothetical protein [Sphaerobacter sp.]